MDNKWKFCRKGLLICSSCFLLIYFLPGRQPSVLTIGIFSESNWGVPSTGYYEVLDEAVRRFEKEHPGIKVEYQSGIRKDDYSEWLSSKLLDETEPDVFMVLADDFDTFSSIGVLKNLDEFISLDETFERADFYESALNYGVYKGQTQYALPYESAPTLMYVNKTLLEQEGIAVPGNDWTWEEFYRICQAVTKDTDGDGIIDQFGVYSYFWTHAVYANGVELFNEEGTESYFIDYRVREAIEFAVKLNGLSYGYQISAEDFDKGNVAFYPLHFPEYRTYKPYPWRIKKYTAFEWECIKLPKGPSGENISVVDTLLFGMSARTPNEELAWEFLKLLTYDEEIQKMIFSHSQGVSVLHKVTTSAEAIEALRQDGIGDSHIDMTFLTEVMEQAPSVPKFRKHQEAMDLAYIEIQQMMRENKNIDNELYALQRKIMKLLGK